VRHAEPIFDIKSEHGEGPVWDEQTHSLYWVDIMMGRFFVGHVESRVIKEFEVGQPLGVLALRENGGLVMAVRDGFGFYDESSNQFELIAGSPEYDNKEVRFNDGAVDPAGRFFAGTMEWEGREDTGKLYRMDADHSFNLVERNIYITNGMDWAPDRKTFYMTDTLRHVIYAYDYDIHTGAVSNRRNYIIFGSDEYPDGMCVDSEGGFWVAMWEGGKILRFDASGKKVGEISVPVLHPTSCCFGGADMKTLFITSSQYPLSEQQKKEWPLAGRTFMLETEIKGQKQARFKG